MSRLSLLVQAEQAALPAGRDVVERWLSSLGTLQAGKANETDAKIKINSYASMLDYPAACFTKTTLDVAARTFSPWFPDYGGLAEFLDEYAVPWDIEFREELPTTMVGKVLRRVLKEEELAKGKRDEKRVG